jgi:hypothetical protein
MQYVGRSIPAEGPLSGRAGQAVLRELLAPGAFVTAILISNYALSALPNVKLFDLLVFVAGYSLGLRRGAAVAVAAWLFYGSFNPWGATHPQLMVTLMASEVGYAAMGLLVRRFVSPDCVRLRPSVLSVGLIVAAVVATVAYDVMANAYTGYFWASIAGSSEYGRWISVALFNPGALFFMAVHVGSNAMLFPVFAPPLIRGADRAKRTLGWG